MSAEQKPVAGVGQRLRLSSRAGTDCPQGWRDTRHSSRDSAAGRQQTQSSSPDVSNTRAKNLIPGFTRTHLLAMQKRLSHPSGQNPLRGGTPVPTSHILPHSHPCRRQAGDVSGPVLLPSTAAPLQCDKTRGAFAPTDSASRFIFPHSSLRTRLPISQPC